MSSDSYSIGAPMTGVAGGGMLLASASLDAAVIAAVVSGVVCFIFIGMWVRRKSRRS